MALNSCYILHVYTRLVDKRAMVEKHIYTCIFRTFLGDEGAMVMRWIRLVI